MYESRSAWVAMVATDIFAARDCTAANRICRTKSAHCTAQTAKTRAVYATDIRHRTSSSTCSEETERSSSPSGQRKLCETPRDDVRQKKKKHEQQEQEGKQKE